MDLNNVALGVVLAWIVLVILFFIFLLRKYTFGNWTEENPNPYKKETMGLPRGILRGVLTLSILFIVMLLEVNNLFFDPQDLEVAGRIFIPEERFGQMLVAFQMVIAFYFGGKVMHHVTQAERDVAKTRAAAAVEEVKQKVSITTPQDFEDQEAQG